MLLRLAVPTGVSKNGPQFSMVSVERFHSHDQHLCKFIGKKEEFTEDNCSSYKELSKLLHTQNPSTQAASGEAINEGVSPLL